MPDVEDHPADECRECIKSKHEFAVLVAINMCSVIEPCERCFVVADEIAESVVNYPTEMKDMIKALKHLVKHAVH